MGACAACGAELPEGARFCPACAAPVERAGVSEERKLAAVRFADLVGPTALASDEDPERTRALLDCSHDAMSAEIAAAGGTVEKFAGDAVMAAFGAPAALEDHAERALHAALSMQRRLPPSGSTPSSRCVTGAPSKRRHRRSCAREPVSSRSPCARSGSCGRTRAW